MSANDPSVDRTENAYESVKTPESRVRSRVLRWWPALLLLVLMFAIRNLASVFESPPFPVLMATFMGPAAISILIMVWWVFASRASILEKMFGLIGVIGIAVVTVWISHPTLQGMPTVVMVFPSGIAAFGIGTVLLAALPRIRLVCSLALCGAVFCFWSQLQNEGFTGDFKPRLSWKWEPTAEDRYVATRTGTKGTTPRTNEKVTLASSQWSSFRGPNRDGKLGGVSLESDWTTNPPKRKWQIPIGPGWSSFTVSGRRLFTQEQRGQNEAVLCLDAETGETIWVYEYRSRFTEAIAGAGPRATPTIADEGLFAQGADGILLRLDPVSGDVVWERDLKKDADRKPPTWGFSASPLVQSGLVIVHAGGPGDKGILAYDVNNGELRWSVASGDHSYSSPHWATFFQVSGILMETNAGLQFLDVKEGTVFWNHEWPVENYRCLQPLVVGNSIYIATSLGKGTRKITVARKDEQWDIQEDWTSTDMKPDFNDFVEHKGSIYGFDARIFGCIDAESGKLKWKKGRYGNGQVLLLPDSNQLLVTSETGELVLVAADPSKFTEIAKFQAIEGKTWNHSVLIGNRVYVRNAEQAACYELARLP